MIGCIMATLRLHIKKKSGLEELIEAFFRFTRARFGSDLPSAMLFFANKRVAPGLSFDFDLKNQKIEFYCLWEEGVIATIYCDTDHGDSLIYGR